MKPANTRAWAFLTAAALATLAACARTAQHAHPGEQVAAAEPEHGAGAPGMMQHKRHLLASAEWLAAHPDSAVVIHVGRTDSLYRAGHVPGARFLPLAAVARTVAGLTNEFPPVRELAETFRALGAGNEGRIVIYGEEAGLWAARAWVALDLLGHGDRAALLDGGLPAWRAAGRPLETGPVSPEPRPFTPRWQAAKLVSAGWIHSRLGDRSVLLVDARPGDQYAGGEPQCPPGQGGCVQIPEARRGHIPGAASLFWMDALVSPQNPVMKSMHEIHHQLWEPAGADRPEVRTIVTYCRSGMQASHAYWQARYIGYLDVRLYDGSFLEWSALPPGRYPVESGAPPAR